MLSVIMYSTYILTKLVTVLIYESLLPVWTVSLENVMTDLHEVDKGMDLTRREYEARKDREPPIILKDFLTNSEDKLKKLKTDAKTAQVSTYRDIDIYVSGTYYMGTTWESNYMCAIKGVWLVKPSYK